MKNLFVLLIFVFFSIQCVLAESLVFNKETYELQYASPTSEGYINEYVRPTQSVNNWTNLVTVHYFPKQKSAEDYINNFLFLINQSETMYGIINFPDKKLISFGIIGTEKNGGYIEYNVLRCDEGVLKGLKVIQFAHKYKFSDEESFKKAVERSKKYNMKYVNSLLNLSIPEIVKEKR